MSFESSTRAAIPLVMTVLAAMSIAAPASAAYDLVDTGQDSCSDTDGLVIDCPAAGEALTGQDAQFTGLQSSYVDNGDGTVTDVNTGLMWQQSPTNTPRSWQDAMDYCDNLVLADYDDWRAPTLKELFAIGDFGLGWPYIDETVFHLAGTMMDKDEQFWASNFYLAGTTHGGAPSAFGVNHMTGHIKAYPAESPGPMGKMVRAVRGAEHGLNDFQDNGDGTVTDLATELMWMQVDAGVAMDWPEALAYADTLTYGGFDDWRLPDVKELQSIVDYSGVLPAIDPLFSCTPIVNEAGDDDYGYYWSSTSAFFGLNQPEYYYAWYVAFGFAVDGAGEDMHGAGAVRFDTKIEGGPLGEGGERYYNQVRCVRDAGSNVSIEDDGDEVPQPVPDFGLRAAPNPFNPSTRLQFTVDRPGVVRVSVHDAQGRLVTELLDENLPLGEHELVWDGKDHQGRTMPSGVYLARLVDSNGAQGVKITLGK